LGLRPAKGLTTRCTLRTCPRISSRIWTTHGI